MRWEASHEKTERRAKAGLKASVILFIGSLIFTNIFGVDHITAWKNFYEGTIIEEYYMAFSILVFAGLIATAWAMKKWQGKHTPKE